MSNLNSPQCNRIHGVFSTIHDMSTVDTVATRFLDA